MAQPTQSQLHLDVPLTNISVAYMQDQKAFIADKVFPTIEVEKQSNKYFVFDQDAFRRDDAKRRGSGEESAGSGYALSSDSYYCDVFALHKDISDYDRANTDSPLDADRNATQFITHQLLLRREKQWAADFFASGVWTNQDLAPTKWDDYTASDPIRVIDNAKRTILLNTGRMANKLVLGLDVFLALKEHPDVVDRIKYTSSRVVTEQVLAGLLGVDEILVPYSIVNSNSEGKTTASLDFALNSKSALLVHVPMAAGLETPSAGYTFAWRGSPGQNRAMGMAMRKMRIDTRLSDRVEGELAFDCKVVGAGLGYFWSSLTA